MSLNHSYQDIISNFYNEHFRHSIVVENEVVKQFSDFNEEYENLRESVGIRDITNYGLLKLTGKDALDFLHRISTNIVNDLEEFQKRSTLFTNEKGRIIDKTQLLKFPDYILLICSKESKEMLFNWINKYIISEDIQVEDISGEKFLFEVIGPQSESYLTLICGRCIDRLDDIKIIEMNAGDASFYVIRQSRYNSYNRYWMLGEIASAPEVLNYLLSHNNIFDIRMVGEKAYNIFRVENGTPLAPFEINDKYNPHEAGLLDHVSFTKGCYIGQEVIARLGTYDKVQRCLRGVIIENGNSPDTPVKLVSESGKEAGMITSAINSNLFERNLGLAYIRKEFADKGTVLYLDGSDKKIKITVAKLPFKG